MRALFGVACSTRRPPLEREELDDVNGASQSRGPRVPLAIAIGGTLLALWYYADWWVRTDRVVEPAFALVLSIVAGYTLAQLLGSWLLYWMARRRPSPPVTEFRGTVDVFLTVCAEPLPLIRRALESITAMRGTFTTWVLDDADQAEVRALARECGAQYRTREGREHYKAGNVNAALPHSEGDVIAFFDVDHAPKQEFLESTLGHFADPDVGFVQVMVTFRNEAESWVARAASESAYDYYNPTCMGADQMGAVSLIGSNAVVRRRALENIGGYHPGLAEDLATSLALHAEGWRSVYVREPLAPGLAPADLRCWFTQQFKWSRGVFELLLTAYPRLFFRMTWRQRLGYLVRMTYYWLGPVFAVHWLFLLGMLWEGTRLTRYDHAEYWWRVTPLALGVLAVRQVALVTCRHPSVRAHFLWRPLVLVTGSWAVYTVAWILALLRVPTSFQPTPKQRSSRVPLRWLTFPFVASCALIVGSVHALGRSRAEYPLALMLYAVAQLLPMLIILWVAFCQRGERDDSTASLTLGHSGDGR